MSKIIHKRLAGLRKFMEEKGMHAFIIPDTDPHLSEYPASHWESRKWISGFTGSAGTLVVTLDKAALWTDSRYFIQASQELFDTEIELCREGLLDTLTIEQWLEEKTSAGLIVGLDANVFSAKSALSLIKKLENTGLKVVTGYDPFSFIWASRPPIPENPVYIYPDEYAGSTAKEKIDVVLNKLEEYGADSLLIASFDTIAWLFNFRGNDVLYNPVAVSYAFVSRKETVLFINPKKINKDIVSYFNRCGITLAEYGKIEDYVSRLDNISIFLSSGKISLGLYEKIPISCRIIDIEPSPVDLMKSIKNETEIAGFRNAVLRDGVALVKFLIWLETAIYSENITELSVVEKITEFRSEQDLFLGESFSTIAGYQVNAAIVHYRVSPENAAVISPEGFLLIDSGAQYFDGTTDITRTISFGKPDEQMKRDYTLVLKGHIALANCRFPQGTRGNQIDILARKALWDNGFNYLHGTGHGIGHFLNVHEGPQSIRTDNNPVALFPGMVISNEPGIYRTDKYGIRIENLILCKKDISTEFGDFYSFETLSLCPIDTTPIIKEMLTKEEAGWLNNYHCIVYDKLSPFLKDTEKEWLRNKTKEI